MSNLISTGLFVMLLCIFYSRSISKHALSLLSDEEKKILAAKFSGFSKFNQIPIIIVFAGYFAIKYFQPSFSNVAFIILILFFLSFLIITSFLIIKKIQETNLPKAYIKKYKQSRLLYNLGFTICSLILLYDFFQ
jgi:hypothetical protein